MTSCAVRPLDGLMVYEKSKLLIRIELEWRSDVDGLIEVAPIMQTHYFATSEIDHSSLTGVSHSV